MFAAGISNKVAETLQWQQQRPSQCPVNQLVFQPQLWHGVHCSQQITGAGKCSLWFPADTHCFITTCSCFSVFQSVTVNMWLPSRGTAITSKCLWHQWTPFGFVIQPLSTEFQPQKRHHAQLALMLWKKMWARRIYLRLSNSIFFNADIFINTFPIDQYARQTWHLWWLENTVILLNSHFSAQADSLPLRWHSLSTANSVLSIILLIIS